MPALLLPLLLVVVIPPGAVLHAQELEWATGVTGDHSLGAAIAVDGQGNSYVTGTFHGTVIFGEGEDNETELTAAGNFLGYLARYASDGALVWATSIDSSDGSGIALGADSAVYVAGGFGVAKYSLDGIPLWARTENGIGRSSHVAVDEAGNIYITGGFEGTASFGLGEDNETTLVTVGSSDAFVAKYSSDGTLIWARATGGTGFDFGQGVATDSSGNAYIIGRLGIEVFIAKYGPDGDLHWNKGIYVLQDEFVFGYGIVVSVKGDVYVTGYFKGSAVFGSNEANETTLNSPRASNIFIAKHASNDGNLLWAIHDGGDRAFSAGLAVALDSAGTITVTGEFEGSAVFGAGTANEIMLSSAGASAASLASPGPKTVVPSNPPVT